MRRWGWLVFLVLPTLAWGQAVPTLPPNVSGLSGCTLANSVLQGGATVTCTATPRITALGLGIAAPASGISIVSTGTFDFNADTFLQRDGAANTLALRNAGTDVAPVPQLLNLYDFWVSGSDYNRLRMGFTSSGQDANAVISVENAGTGGANTLDMKIPTGGQFEWFNGASAIMAINTSGTKLTPATNGGLALGGGSVGWSKLYMDYTNTTTVGPVTINKAAMRVLVAAAGKSILVTDNIVTAASHVICSNASATPTTPTVVSAVPASGTFTLTVMQMPSVFAYDCFVINAD